jgi:hypothetical protein
MAHVIGPWSHFHGLLTFISWSKFRVFMINNNIWLTQWYETARWMLGPIMLFFRSRCTGYHKTLTLLRYSRACAQHSDFLDIVQLLIQNLLKHGYVAPKLKSSLLKLYGHLHVKVLAVIEKRNNLLKK